MTPALGAEAMGLVQKATARSSFSAMVPLPTKTQGQIEIKAIE